MTVPNEASFIDDVWVPEPYAALFTIEGTRDYLFNRYDVPANGNGEDDQTKIVRKPDRPLGTMVHLDADGNLAARSAQVWNATVAAGKYRKNPRNARGSLATVLRDALDEVEGLDPRHTELLTFTGPDGEPYGKWEWEFTARTAHRGGYGTSYVTKVRPALRPGWRLSGRFTVILPQYVSIGSLHEALEMAGRFGGIGDGRSGGLGFGRFRVVSLEQASA